MNALSASLVRFESELVTAIRRDRLRRRRRVVTRLAFVVGAAAAVALGALSVLPGSGSSAVARAAAALTTPSDSILHIVLVTTQTNPDGSASTSRIESWAQAGPPYLRREVDTRDGHRFEAATAHGEVQLYDPRTNTVYAAPLGGSAKAPPAAKTGDAGTADDDPYRAKILSLLNSGAAREDGHVLVDSRDAIRIVGTTTDMTLLVDASTFQPIEWRVSEGGTETTTRVPIYERLAPTDANTALLSPAARHPGATIDRDPGDYQAAVARVAGKSREPSTANGKG